MIEIPEDIEILNDKVLLVQQWNIDQGDEVLRLDYPLDDNSIVFDLGGYKGEWSRDIFCMYNCYLYVFEPLEDFYTIIKNRFKKNKRVNIFPVALGTRYEETRIYLDDNASSVFKKDDNEREMISIKMIELMDFLKINSIKRINLLKMNIEGSEYDLLEKLIEEDWIKNIDHIQVQFHEFIPNCIERRNKIIEKLSKTHNRTYNYDFVWESWTIK